MPERRTARQRERVEAVLRGAACLRAAHPYLDNALHELMWDRGDAALAELQMAQKMAESAIAVIVTAQKALRGDEDAG